MSSWIWRYTNLVYLFIYLFINTQQSHKLRENDMGTCTRARAPANDKDTALDRALIRQELYGTGVAQT